MQHSEIVQKIKSAEGQFLKKHSLVQFTLRKNQEQFEIPFDAVLGNNQVNQKIQQILLQMKVGQQWKIKINQSGKQELYLINVIASRQKQQEYFQSLYTKSQKGKAKGNQFIKAKDYKNAYEVYQKAYKLIQYDFNPQNQELKLSIISNLALASLNINKFQQTIDWCKKHLQQTEQPNKKTMYRKVQGYKGLKNWSQAKKIVQQSLQIWTDVDTQNDFKSLHQQICKQQKQQLAKQKNVYGKMFK